MGKRNQSPNQLANLKKFQKGNNANPIGGNAHSPGKKMIKALTKERLKELINAATNGSVADLKKVVNNPNSTALEVALATCMVKFINKGDWTGLESMLTRSVGKVKDEVDLNHNGIPQAPPAQVHVYIPANGRTKEENE